MPVRAIRIGKRGRGCPSLVLARWTKEFSIVIDALLRAGRVGATTQWYACVEAITPEKSACRWNVHTHVVTIGIIAIDGAKLIVDQEQLHNVGCTAGSIKGHRIMHDG